MLNKNFEILDKIIMSENSHDEFFNLYKKDKDFTNWLNDFIPEIELCENREQDTPWHKYNVLRHILYSVENMNKQTVGLDFATRRLLAYVMLFHDIGKPAAHIKRLKNGKMVDSFFNHNVKSVEIAEKILPRLNFNDDEVKIILKLIYKHDIFMFIRDGATDNPYHKSLSKNLILEEIKDLSQVGDGYTLMRCLVKVGRSDSLAQNEKMTEGSLRLLDKINLILDEINNK